MKTLFKRQNLRVVQETLDQPVPLMFVGAEGKARDKERIKGWLKGLAAELIHFGMNSENDHNKTTTSYVYNPTLDDEGKPVVENGQVVMKAKAYTITNNIYRRLKRAFKKRGFQGVKQYLFEMQLKYAMYKDVKSKDEKGQLVLENKRVIPASVRNYYNSLIQLVDFMLLPCRDQAILDTALETAGKSKD